MTKPANDNVKMARGSLADALTAVLEFRNRPDSPPDPLQSSWSTDPSTVIPDGTFDGDDEPEAMAEDLLLEITPSIAKIMHEVKVGAVKRVGGKNGAIIEIGKLKFSDGTQTEQAMVNGATGVELKKVVMRPGAMLGTTEKLGGSHGGTGAAVVTISNAALSGRLCVPHRAYIPTIRDRRKGKSFTAEQSRANLAKAISNTPVLPPVTFCPPGLASGTARYSDQFIGMKIGSSGKGGAPSWTDEFMAMRDHADWQAAIRDAEPQHLAVIKSAMSAKAIAELGDKGHRRTMERQGWRKLAAANDNLAENKRKFAA
ncbi:hypothetical protein N8A98_06910 [Devosia neptuniae]|uniref:Uncharacterized protein n=1 Tax=Devosia neptuniae TaxID=191302 RepID=A0ABY6CIA1_9HYPH|nr:hypothetical protein [Devosia neptuniae]UXN70911.1 hypothetical protein N8A98_06910 [Devosia neptuniae]